VSFRNCTSFWTWLFFSWDRRIGILIVALLLAIVNYWLSEICEAIERIAEK